MVLLFVYQWQRDRENFHFTKKKKYIWILFVWQLVQLKCFILINNILTSNILFGQNEPTHKNIFGRFTCFGVLSSLEDCSWTLRFIKKGSIIDLMGSSVFNLGIFISPISNTAVSLRLLGIEERVGKMCGSYIWCTVARGGFRI